MQHDGVMTKLNFDLLTPTPSSPRGLHRSWIINHDWYVSYLLYLCKNIDDLMSYCDCFIFDFLPNLRGQGVGLNVNHCQTYLQTRGIVRSCPNL